MTFFISVLTTYYLQNKVLDVAVWPGDESQWPKRLFEHIFDPSKPLPDPSDYKCSSWDYIINSLLTRVHSAMEGILGHATKLNTSWLRLAGSGGVLSAVRAAEFCSRIMRARLCHESFTDRIIHITQALSNIFAQEAWRRWALASFLQSHHLEADDLFILWQVFMEAVLNAHLKGNDVWLFFLMHITRH